MALPMHIIGNGTAYGDNLGARRDRKNPATRNGKPLDIAQ